MTKNAKDKLIEASYQLMLTKGYSSTTVDELCETAQVSKGSFYHYFKTKEDLGLALLDDFFIKAKAGFLNGPFRNQTDPVKSVIEFLKQTENTASILWKNGCLLGSFAGDLAETNPNIRKKVSQILRSVTLSVSEIFEPFSKKFPKNKQFEPHKMAEMYLTIIEGGIIVSKAHKDWKFLYRGLKTYRENVEVMIR